MTGNYVTKIKYHQGRVVSPFFDFILDKLEFIVALFLIVLVGYASREVWNHNFDREDFFYGLLLMPFVAMLVFFIRVSKRPSR
jgi:hypothetical protein